ncbi:hypothetical protein STEG23_009982 [Scotinomys teguina]
MDERNRQGLRDLVSRGVTIQIMTEQEYCYCWRNFVNYPPSNEVYWPSTGEVGAPDLCEFKPSLVYIARPRADSDYTVRPCLKNKNPKIQNLRIEDSGHSVTVKRLVTVDDKDISTELPQHHVGPVYREVRSPPLWSVAATMGRPGEEFAISSGEQVALMTVGSEFAAPFFSVSHQLLQNYGCLIHLFNRGRLKRCDLKIGLNL